MYAKIMIVGRMSPELGLRFDHLGDVGTKLGRPDLSRLVSARWWSRHTGGERGTDNTILCCVDDGWSG